MHQIFVLSEDLVKGGLAFVAELHLHTGEALGGGPLHALMIGRLIVLGAE